MRKKILPVFLLAVALVFCACQEEVPAPTVSVATLPPVTEPAPTETLPPQTEPPFTGWAEIDGETVYLDADIIHTGWLTLEDGTYYLDDQGHKTTGWLDLDGRTFYFLSDGRAAQGKHIMEETTYYFSSKGEHIALVNRWNTLSWEYAPEIVEAVDGCWVSPECADALKQMMSDLENEVGVTSLLNGYRSYTKQCDAFYSSVNHMVKGGMSYDAAYASTINSLAIPGTSEHQLGLAVDIMNPHDLFYEKGETEVLRWLKTHCWDYGFILRYPENTAYITGIIFEPWHYRYVGLELAMELRDNGLCLEQYLDQLTNDGTTCGDPGSLLLG